MAISEKMISRLEEEIRSLVSIPRIKRNLMSNEETWVKLCSSLDIIGDTEEAFHDYLAHEGQVDQDNLYLVTYGVVQALVMQQDAVCTISGVLNGKPELSDELRKIREICQLSTGRSITLGEQTPPASSFISRAGMEKESFDLMLFYDNGRPNERWHVDLPDLISKQRGGLGSILQGVLQAIKDQETAHRRKFRTNKIADVFDTSLRYSLRNLIAATHTYPPPQNGLEDLKAIVGKIGEFKDELERRRETYIFENFSHNIGHITHALEILGKYFEDHEKSELRAKESYIYARFIESEFEILKQVAEDLDKEYANDL